MIWPFSASNTVLELPPLRLFNTESRSLEAFTPLNHKEVRIYTCGPTVYDFAHIGNLRAYVFADLLKRTLAYNGYTVNHTINYTDFGHLTSDADHGDDKMMRGLVREGMEISLESMRILSDRYIHAFNEDIKALNIIAPSQFARASDYVTEQIKLIETLEEKGYTYSTSDGVYFDISKFPSYGRLGNIDVNTLKSGARVEINPEKRHPADFALWKNGKLGWKSKWGTGFPGWHVECSAMAFATLGKQIDVHTGGVDNMATHHNAEIAQCESASGKQFSRYWMHSEHVLMNDTKLAKSAGNGKHLEDLYEEGFSALDYRYWLLTSHYRSVINFSRPALEGAQQAHTRLRRFMFEDWADEKGRPSQPYLEVFGEAINDDLDTPRVIALVWEVAKDEKLTPGQKRATILDFDTVLGLGLGIDPAAGRAALGYVTQSEIPANIRAQMDEREAARVARNWAEADRIRDTIRQSGYEIEDTPEGPKLTKLS